MGRKKVPIKEEALGKNDVKSQHSHESDKGQDERNYKPLKRNKSNESRYHCYHWKENHNRKYLYFLVNQYDLFALSLIEKRKKRLFIKMSRAIGRKTLSQCHSHHRTMLEKYDNIDNIIKYLCITFETTIQEIGEAHQELMKKNKETNRKFKLEKTLLNSINRNVKIEEDIEVGPIQMPVLAPQLPILKEEDKLEYVYY